MALEYTAYFDGSAEDLAHRVDAFLTTLGGKDFFEAHGFEDIDAFTREILAEEGFSSKYQSSVWFRLRKTSAVEATESLKLLRNDYLGRDMALVLLNGDAVLSD